MSDFALNDGIDEEEDEFDESIPTFSGREGTIYLIDAADTITGDPDTFRLCLECIEADMLKGILINAKDLVSVVFYNTQKSPLPETSDVDTMSIVVPDNCAIFMPMQPLNKECIQYFKNFRQSNDFFDFANKYGSSTGSCFSESLWLCSRLIMRCNYKLVNSKIILFTNNEQPHSAGNVELRKAYERAKDLFDINCIVDLVPMVDEFNLDLFYKEFLCAVHELEPDEFRINKPAEQRKALLQRLFRRNFRKNCNCMRHLQLHLGDDLAIECDVHSFTRKAQKPSAVKILKENNDVVIAKRVHYLQERDLITTEIVNERKLLPGEFYKSLSVCGKEIIFSVEELTTIKALISPGIRLIGFKPLSALPQRWFIKPIAFLYPNDKRIKGSTTLFRALWEKCLERQKYALCALTFRRKTAPRYVWAH